MKEIQIFDGEGFAIPTLLFKDSKKNFSVPTLIIDIFQEKEITPEIKYFWDVKGIEILEEISFVLCALPIGKKKAWAPRQKAVYFLRQKESPIEENARIITKMPANHCIEVDIANRKVRVSGKFIEKNKTSSEWMYY